NLFGGENATVDQVFDLRGRDAGNDFVMAKRTALFRKTLGRQYGSFTFGFGRHHRKILLSNASANILRWAKCRKRPGKWPKRELARVREPSSRPRRGWVDFPVDRPDCVQRAQQRALLPPSPERHLVADHLEAALRLGQNVRV